MSNESTASKAVGLAAYERGEWDTALQTFLELVRAQKADLEVFLAMGKAYQAKGRPNEAVEAMNRAIALDNQNYEAFLVLGQVIARWGKPEEAINLLVNASKLNPKAAQPLMDLGRVYAQRGELEQEAHAAHRDAGQPDPAHEQAPEQRGAEGLLEGDLPRPGLLQGHARPERHGGRHGEHQVHAATTAVACSDSGAVVGCAGWQATARRAPTVIATRSQPLTAGGAPRILGAWRATPLSTVSQGTRPGRPTRSQTMAATTRLAV